jgi:hypothetical protein
MKKGILILLLLVSNQLFSQLTYPSSKILIGKDTLTCLKTDEIKLINKAFASEKFYHSMYKTNMEKIDNLTEQVSLAEDIATQYMLSLELKEKQYENLNLLYDQKVVDYNSLEDDYWRMNGKRWAWKTATILGVPIAFTGGILLTVKLLK